MVVHVVHDYDNAIILKEALSAFTGPLWGESTAHQWIPLTKGSGAEFWGFLWSALEQTVQQTIQTPVIWDAIAFIMAPL